MKWTTGTITAVVGALTVAIVAALVIGVVADNRWSARCHRAGGHNEQHYEGVIMMPVGKVIVPEPQYSDHCIVNGREVHV